MGYPMTWQRLIRRNHLDDGNYEKEPAFWHRHASVILPDYRENVVVLQGCIKSYEEQVERQNNQMRLFAGDLRRLEMDARDERALCEWIAQRTNVGADAVALVLKEFFAL